MEVGISANQVAELRVSDLVKIDDAVARHNGVLEINTPYGHADDFSDIHARRGVKLICVYCGSMNLIQRLPR